MAPASVNPNKIVYDYILPPKTGCLAFVAPGEMLRITRTADGHDVERHGRYAFVPLLS